MLMRVLPPSRWFPADCDALVLRICSVSVDRVAVSRAYSISINADVLRAPRASIAPGSQPTL